MKILITGGHITPALAVADELVKHEGVSIVFVGRKHTEGVGGVTSLEYKEVEKRHLRFVPIRAGRLTRVFSFASVKQIFQIPVGLVRAYRIMRAEQPHAVLSFGGYIAAAVATVAWLQKIPIYTHEQTLRPGAANIAIGKIAKKIFVSFASTVEFFPASAVVVTGNPVRSAIFETRKKPFVIPGGRPVLYVTGGSLGSHSINMHIKHILPKLLSIYTIVHQTGDTRKYKDFEELTATRHKLPQHLKDRYFVVKHFLEDEVGYIYAKCDLVIGRAGANTFFELVALEKPAILVPLPWAGFREQEKQAEIFKKSQVGEVFNQSHDSAELLALIAKMIVALDEYRQNFKNLTAIYRKDAAEKIAEAILQK